MQLRRPTAFAVVAVVAALCLSMALGAPTKSEPFPPILATDSPVAIEFKKALQKVDLKTLAYNMQHSGDVKHYNADAPHVRSRRAANFDMPTCDPGWTGGACEFPICDDANNHQHPEDPTQETLVDFYYQKPGSAVYVYVDNTMNVERFDLISTAVNANPGLQVVNSSGASIPPNTQTNDASTATYTYHNLPAGVYKLSIVGDVVDTEVLISFYAHTYLTTEVGGIPYDFLDEAALHNDYPNPALYKNTPTVFVATPVGLEHSGSLETVSFFSFQTLAGHNIRLNKRYGCHYQYYTAEFECKAEGTYFARLRGYDFYGHSFTRIHSFHCEVNPATTVAPVTTTTAPNTNITCVNGGLRITNTDGSQYCYCHGRFTGTYCQKPLCMNGGSLFGSICSCQAGYTGIHCQHVQCTDDAGAGFYTGTPILTFVLRINKNLNDVIGQVASAVQAVTNDLEYDSAYVSRFGLITFNGNTTDFHTLYSATDVVSRLQSLATSNDTSGGCQDNVFEAVSSAFYRFLITNKSPVYVITDAVSHDHDFFVENVMHIDSFYNAPINFIVVEPAQASGCPEIDINSPSLAAMGLTARRFSGIATIVRNENRGNVGALLQAHLGHTYHKAHLVFSDDQRVCQHLPLYIPISVDAQFHELTIVVEGVNTTVQLNNPEGDVVQLSGSYSLGAANIFWLTGLEFGTWTATVISHDIRAPCGVRAYAVEEPTPNTIGQDYHLVWGITDNLNSDAPFRQPLVHREASIVAHIENYPLRDPWTLYAELVVFRDGRDLEQGRDFVSASNGVWRDSCSYEIYFPPIICENEGDNLYFTVFVRDGVGATIQRSGVFYCATIPPTPPPAPGSCSNGGVNYNGTCICQEGWTGDNCQTRVCYNNGTRDPLGHCICPAGTTGDSCEVLSCINKNPDPFLFSTQRRHHLFVLDVTQGNAAVLFNLANHVGEIIRDIALQDKDWISRYQIVGVDSTQYYHLGDAAGFEVGRVHDAFYRAYQISQNNTDTGCRAQIYEALGSILLNGSRALNENSYITIFTTAAPDESRFLDVVIPIYNEVLSRRHFVNIFVASKARDSFYCGNTTDYDLFRDLATLTEGRFIPLDPSDIYQGLKLIPTWFQTSLVYGRYFADCSNTVSVFAPIDSYTQSIQIYLNGQNVQNGLSINFPNGTATNLAYGVLTDNANQFGFYDYRAECDPDWEGVAAAPYCFRAFHSKVGWTDAQQVCADDDGFLVDDLTAAKDGWLATYSATKAVWIGLNSLNGTWLWDRGFYGFSDSLNGSAYTKWANGDNSIDPAKPCVYRDSDGFWKKDACNATNYFYICQKHKYSSSFVSNLLEDDSIPPGRWQFNLQGTGDCALEIRVQSAIRVYSGFTTHTLDDYPEFNAASGTTQNRAVTHLVSIAAPNFFPFLRFAQITDGFNATLLAAATYQYRENCAYEYVSQNFTCPTANRGLSRFNTIHIGEDEFGLPFQRITTGICLAETRNCGNGGIVYDGLCVCDEYWTGQYCEVPICVNGGTYNTADSTCACPTGFTGSSCQFDVCFAPSNATFSIYGKTLVLVVEATTQNAAAVNSLATNFTGVLDGIDPNWFDRFVVVSFDSTGVINAQSVSTTTAAGTLLNKVASSLTANNACDLPVLEAVIKGLTINQVDPQSVVYLVTTAGSSATDQQKVPDFFTAAAGSSIQLQYLLVNSTSCTTGVSGQGRYFVADLALATDGNAIEIAVPSQAGSFVHAHLPTLYNGSLTGTPTHRNNTFACVQTIFYAAVEANVHTVYLYSFSNVAVPSVQGPYTRVSLTTLFDDGHARILSFTPEDGQGIYTVTINDTGACNLQVRFQGGAEVYTGYIGTGTAPDVIGSHLDNSTLQPVAGNNVLVAHVAHERSMLTYAQFWPGHTPRGEVQYVQLYRRGGCSYEFYSDNFICDEYGYHVFIYGIDHGGQPFVRQTYIQCTGYTPGSTIAPPVTTPGGPTTLGPVTTAGPVTQPGGGTTTTIAAGTTPSTSPATTSYGYLNVQADITLLLDVGGDVSTAQQAAFKSFFVTALSQFNVGWQKNLQVSIVNIYGDDIGAALQASPFSGVSDTTGLGNAIASAYDGFSTQGGQSALKDGFAFTISTTGLNNGYRSGINNHLIIYATTNATADTAAVTAAASVISSGKYSVAAVAYGANGSNTASLTSLVGGKAGCVITANDANGLTTTAANALVTLIWNAANNNGAYCT